MAIALRVLFAMYRSGLNGSFFGSVNSQGGGVRSSARADTAHAASTVSAAHRNWAEAVDESDRDIMITGLAGRGE